MMLLNSCISVNSLPVEKKIELSDIEFVYKVKNPIFDIGNTFGVPFQPILFGYHDKDNLISDNYNIIIFPVIPQYFHNFFEIFTKILKLKNAGEKFKVGLVYANGEYDPLKVDGIFDFFIRGLQTSGPNAAHLKDFFEYINIDYVCLTVNELKSLRCKATYLFFDSCSYMQDDPFVMKNDIKYSLANFLKVPGHDVLIKDFDLLRNTFPKSYVSNIKKIYISRKKTWDRKYQYENELDSMFESLGYTIVFLEDMPLLEQIRLLQISSHIVCPYGSALVNTCLLSSDNHILSINYTPGYYIHSYDLAFSKYNIPYKHINIEPNINPVDLLKNTVLEWEENVNKNFI